MIKINKSALVNYSATSMFALVDDIEAYPEFLPWCGNSKIISRTNATVEARINFVKGGFKKSLITRNKLENNSTITMSLLEGPFSHLEGVWQFLPLREDASKIMLHLEFEMLGKLADLTFGTIFNQVCNTLVNSFTSRAKQLYG